MLPSAPARATTPHAAPRQPASAGFPSVAPAFMRIMTPPGGTGGETAPPGIPSRARRSVRIPPERASMRLPASTGRAAGAVDGGSHHRPDLHVELPDGVRMWFPAVWTSLGARDPDAPRLLGELPDLIRLRNLPGDLERRPEATDGQGTRTVAAGARPHAVRPGTVASANG